MKVSSTSLIVAAVAAEALTFASASNSPRSGHRNFASRMKRAVGLAEMQKRQTYSGTATWYGAGVSEGACGVYSSASDFIVALNTQLYGNQNAQSSWCGKSLVITGGGVTHTATVVDACPSCPSDGDLDMSTGLFQAFGESLGTGTFDISWHVAGQGGSSSSGNDNQAPAHTHTHTTHTTPTHTHTTHTPTSTSTRSTSTSTSSTSTIASSATTAPLDTSTVAPTATETAADSISTSTAGDAQNLAGLSELFAGMVNIANAGQT
jgi:hypothetical protein